MERIFNTKRFSKLNNRKFILLLRKGSLIMIIWMIGKNSKKHQYLILLMEITRTQREFVRILK